MSKNNNYKVYVHIAPNGKRYYGITKQKVEYRWKNGKGYSGNEYFARAINKYGWDNFEHIIIAKGLDEEEAKWLEIELIREFDTTNPKYGYNISLGGESSNGYKWTEEQRKKLSESKKGENHPMYGKTLSEEHKQRIGEANKGHEVNEEARKKMSEASKKHWQNEEYRNYMSEVQKGKIVSEEARKKLSEAKKGENNPMYGKTHTEETRRKISEAKKDKYKGKNSPNKKEVYCVELDMFFNTVIECAEYLGCTKGNVSSVLNGWQKTCKGYHIIYAKDKDKLAS